MEWYIKAIKQYADFEGRARRTEYWMFFLINLIFSLIASLTDIAMGTFSAEAGIGTFGTIYSAFILIPNIAVMVRRLHDTGKSAWMLLVLVIPFLGVFYLVYLLTIDSEPGTNRFGPNPKDIEHISDNNNNQFL